MDRLKTENAGSATGTPPKREASDAQIVRKKLQQLELDLPLPGSLHARLIRHSCHQYDHLRG